VAPVASGGTLLIWLLLFGTAACEWRQLAGLRTLVGNIDWLLLAWAPNWDAFLLTVSSLKESIFFNELPLPLGLFLFLTLFRTFFTFYLAIFHLLSCSLANFSSNFSSNFLFEFLS